MGGRALHQVRKLLPFHNIKVEGSGNKSRCVSTGLMSERNINIIYTPGTLHPLALCEERIGLMNCSGSR